MKSDEKRVSLKSILFVIVSILLISVTAFAAAAQGAADSAYSEEKAISALAVELESKDVASAIVPPSAITPHPGMCFFADSDGNCFPTKNEYNVIKRCINGVDNVVIPGYTCSDLYDLNGDGKISRSDLGIWLKIYYYSTHRLNRSPRVDGAPKEIRLSNNDTSINASVLAKTGKPVAGIGVIFQSSNPDVLLRGRDVFDGNSYIESYRVFELTDPVTGEAAVDFVNPHSEDFDVTASIPMDTPKGLSQNIQKSMSVKQNSAPVIEINYPQGTLSGIVNVSWNVTDPNGDEMTGIVYVSRDNSTTWEDTHLGEVLPAIDGIEFDTNDAPNGVYMIRVNVTDEHGASTVYTTEPITLRNNHAPVIDNVPNQIVRENETLTFTAGVSDPDNDTITYTVGNLPEGAEFNYTTYTFTWTPTFDQARENTYVIDFTATDGELYDGIDVSIEVIDVNRAPVFDDVGPFTINENETLSFSVNAVDPDSDEVAIIASELPQGAVFDESTNTFTWTPDFSQAGEYRINFTATDGDLSETKEVLVIVNNINRAPIMSETGNWIVNENETLAFAVHAEDADNDTLIFSADNIPEGAVFDASTQAFSWTPTFRQSGEYDVTFTVTDGELSDSKQSHIEVRNVNSAPVFDSQDSFTVHENETLTFVVYAFDAEGDDLTYDMTDAPAGAIFDATTQAFTWTPGFEDAGNYSATFTASDNEFTAEQTVSIEVLNTNRAPVIVLDYPSGVISGMVNISWSVTDPDGDSLTAVVLANRDNGATWEDTHLGEWLNPVDSVEVDSAGAENGVYILMINATDSNGASTVYTTQPITIFNNHPPTLQNIENIVVNEGELVSIVPNATDPEGDNLTITFTSPLNGSGEWQTDYDDAGTYTTTVTASDGEFNVSQDVTIIVNNVNRAPVFSTVGSLTVHENETLTFAINAADPDGDSVVYSVSSLPQGATFNESTQIFAWTPGFNQSGNYTVTFNATDGMLTTSADVTIQVLNVNRAPVLYTIPSITVNEGQNVVLNPVATDADGDVLQFSASNLPVGAAFNATTQVFSWTPAYNQSGNYTVTFSVTDGELTDSKNTTIIVRDAFEYRNMTVTLTGQPLTGTGHLNAQLVCSVDGGETPYSYSWSIYNRENTVTYMHMHWPDNNTSYNFNRTLAPGNWTAICLVKDSRNNTAYSNNISMTVTPSTSNTNHAPVISVSYPSGTLSGDVRVSWSITDPDGDLINAQAYYSTNHGSSWHHITGSYALIGNRTIDTTDYDDGEYMFRINATDGQLSSTYTTTVRVNNTEVNDSNDSDDDSSSSSHSSNSGSGLGGYYDSGDGDEGSSGDGDASEGQNLEVVYSDIMPGTGEDAPGEENKKGSVLFTLLGIFIIALLFAIVAFGVYKYYASQKKDMVAEEQPAAYS